MRITGGFLKNQPLKTPKGDKTRPTSEKLRQSVFNITQGSIEHAAFLDLYAGSGAMGIEALSRGAKTATFIEKERLALTALRDNIAACHLSSCTTVLAGDVLLLLGRLKGKFFDLIYIDPPYKQGLQEKTLVLIDQLNLLSPKGMLFVEESFQKELQIPPLRTIILKKKRKMGSSLLYQFEGPQAGFC